MTRHFISLISFIFISLSLYASSGKEDVSMVGYEQSWLDSHGTISLKNNTPNQIHNVKFMLIYYDMKGNQLDYEEIFRPVNIAPGLVRKTDVPAYEHNRNYHYYKTPNNVGKPTFKVEYKLIDYNISQDETDKDYYRSNNYKEDSDTSYIIILLCIALIGLSIYVGTYVLVAVMAKQRNRNPALWLVISFIATPILVIIILWIIGDAYNYEQ